MLIKALGATEFAVTDVALVAAAVVSRAGVPSRLDGVVVVPSEQTFGDDAVGVALTKGLMNDIARQVSGFGTR